MTGITMAGITMRVIGTARTTATITTTVTGITTMIATIAGNTGG
jgi:hypothetical protein